MIRWMKSGWTVAGFALLLAFAGSAPVAQAGPGVSGGLIFGDFDGDGDTDIFFRNPTGGVAGLVGFWQMNALSIAAGSAFADPGSNFTPVGTGDLDGDGKSDIIWRRDDGVLFVWLMDGPMITNSSSLGNPGGTFTVAGIADFNDDGRQDILFQNDAALVAVWLVASGGLSVQQGAAIGNPGADWTVEGAGDFDNDGMADVFFRNPNLGANGLVGFWFINGTSISGGAAFADPGPTVWTVRGLGDFDDNGTVDVLWQNNNTRQLFIWFMNGSTIANSGSPGTPPTNFDVVHLGDFNANGNADVLFRNNLGLLAGWLIETLTVTQGAAIGNPGSSWIVVTAGQ